MSGDLVIRPMAAAEVAIAVDWAAAEGWNPGLADAGCFAAVAAGDFLIGEYRGEPAAVISLVNYDERFGFLGFYIVRPDLRGRGFGWDIWQRAIKHVGSRAIGLDGVVAQQGNYRKSGFVLSHRNVRFGGTIVAPPAPPPSIVALSAIGLDALAGSDAEVFPARRPAFLREWIAAPGHIGRALMRDGGLAAWGVIRPCRIGHKIGPLVAEDRKAAETILMALVHSAGGGEIFLDVPQPNGAAVALAESVGLSPVFETARMYRGLVPPPRIERLFGVATFELG